MPEFGDVGRSSAVNPELRQKLVIVEFVGGDDRDRLRTRQEPLMIEGFKHGAAVGQLSEAIEAHCVQSLEDVAFLPVGRGMATLLDETLNFLKPGNDALFARRPA